MNCRIKVLPNFAKDLKRLSKKYPSIKQDYANLLSELKSNPYSGIDLGCGLRKVKSRKSKVKGQKSKVKGQKSMVKKSSQLIARSSQLFIIFAEIKKIRFCKY